MGGATYANGLGTAGGGNGGYYNTVGALVQATSGTANTGGGGGGAGTAQAGSGGSGIVIIRYPQTLTPPTSVTGNVQIGYAAGYQIYTWTSSGTVTF
jgi:hypothetical protein